MVEGLKTAAQKSVKTALPLTISYPVGVCCHEFATIIQKAERVEPSATINVENQLYRAKDVAVESDWTSASYWYEMVAFAGPEPVLFAVDPEGNPAILESAETVTQPNDPPDQVKRGT